MNTGLKIAAFAAALAATFGTAYGAGAALDPVVADGGSASHGEHRSEKPGRADPDGNKGHDDPGTPAAGGLQVTEGGYTLALGTERVAEGKESELRFAILDEAGRKLTSYRREHGKELHFIVASRDLTVYRHLHPARAADGTWSVRTTLPEAGGYRAFADFKPGVKGAEGVTLGADLAVTGTAAPASPPAPSRTAKTDGYEVTLGGELRPGKARELTLRVTKDGRPVRDLQPYLGAYGHLVALRSGDLAYLHVHPGGEPGDGSTKPGPEISFTATAPSAGTYRLFLDFRHEGKVRTAAFTVRAGTTETAEAGEGDAAGGAGHDESGHVH
ncbi:hypothetical protein [Streptomyces sp. NA04227]|uniref:hypothetical protein n=1 Tax=Streptomyces sp. NA04227 TaxID=2742136 RepID=UPI0020CA3051|nr:hypothetical protein [Streptomyces sp. NA04227]